MRNWYEISNSAELPTPALLVYEERIRFNIDLAIRNVTNPTQLRPHIKTHKSSSILALQIAAGVSKFKCATLGEADLLGREGVSDVLLAYPLQQAKFDQFLFLIRKYPKTQFSTLVDNLSEAKRLGDITGTRGLTVDVFVDLDVGMGRTGVTLGEAAVKLYEEITHIKGLNVKGFHAYDGHVREKDLTKRSVICQSILASIRNAKQRIVDMGLPEPILVVGGSPSFPIYSKEADLECGLGTYVLWDKGYADSLPEQLFLPAAVLMCRVVSKPGIDAICVDLGYKAVASENPLNQRLYFLDRPDLTPKMQSEEHLVLTTSKADTYQIGDVLYALPIHICPTVNLYNCMLVVKNGRCVDQWEIDGRNRL